MPVGGMRTVWCSRKARTRRRSGGKTTDRVHVACVSCYVSNTEAKGRALFQVAPPNQTRAVSFESIEAMNGLCADIQLAPPTQKHAVSVASMEAVHGLCAGIQIAPPKQILAVSARSMEVIH